MRVLFSGLNSRLDSERERWFIWLPVPVGFGICIYFALPWEPEFLWLLLSFIIPAALAYLLRSCFISSLFLIFITFLASGMLLTKVHTMRAFSPVVPKGLGYVTVRGFVEAVEPQQKGRSRLTIRLSELGDRITADVPFRITVSLPKRCHLPQCRPGQAIELKTFLNPPKAPVVPGGYDSALFQYFRRIGGVGFSPRMPEIWETDTKTPIGLKFSGFISYWRNLMGERIRLIIGGESGSVAAALLVGLRGWISKESLEILRISGLAHILAVSGLHMSLVAGCLFWFVRAVLAAIPFLAHGLYVKKIAAILALIGATFYLILSGASTATWRAYVMIAVLFLAILCGRIGLSMRNIALAALLIMAMQPESILSPGFRMSFAATIGLVAAYEWYLSRNPPDSMVARNEHFSNLFGLLHAGSRYILSLAATTLIASTVTAPFAAYHFHRMAPFSILGNLFAMPFVTLIVMPFGLMAFVLFPFGLERFPLFFMGWGVDMVLASAKFVSGLPMADISVPQMPTMSLILLTLGGLWFAIWQRNWRIWGVFPIVAGLLLACLVREPDLLVGEGGKIIALRNPETRLLDVLAFKKSHFVVSRWLEQDGDFRDPKSLKSTIFECTPLSCVAPLASGGILSIIRDEKRILEECRRARIAVILSGSSSTSCIGPQKVLMRSDLYKYGNHAFWVGQYKIKEKKSKQEPKSRPWRF